MRTSSLWLRINWFDWVQHCFPCQSNFPGNELLLTTWSTLYTLPDFAFWCFLVSVLVWRLLFNLTAPRPPHTQPPLLGELHGQTSNWAALLHRMDCRGMKGHAPANVTENPTVLASFSLHSVNRPVGNKGAAKRRKRGGCKLHIIDPWLGWRLVLN